MNFPWVYRMLQCLIRSKKFTSEYVNKYVKTKEGEYILDIGCGTADVLEFLPKVKYYGFDSNHKYIDNAKKRFGNRGIFFCQELNEASIPNVNFDIVLANTVLHHLNDDEAIQLFKLSAKCLKHGGRVITCDGCYSENGAFISKILLSLDRGKYVRHKEGYLKLAREVFNKVEYQVRNDLSNIPGELIIICCTKD